MAGQASVYLTVWRCAAELTLAACDCMENSLYQSAAAGRPAVRLRPIAKEIRELRAVGGAQIIPFPLHLARARQKA